MGKLSRLSPIAFLSYVHDDDTASFGLITRLRQQLEAEVRVRLGDKSFAIFHDRKDIAWGEQWRKRLSQGVNSSALFLPVISPSYFSSSPCRDELTGFFAHEAELDRSDLVLPLHLLTVPELTDESTDHLKAAVAAHQLKDWRHLRRESQMSPAYLSALDECAERIAALVLSLGYAQPAAPALIPARKVGETATSAEAEAQTPSPAAASAFVEPPTLVVDAMSRGQYLTITAAIAAAAPGSRILIRPGYYSESLVLNKPLELIGDGEPGSVVVAARDKTVLHACTSMGRIANLTFRQLGGEFYCVKVSQGRIEIEECEISSLGFACVAIYDHADPILHRNRIVDSKKGGVFVYKGGRGTIEDNDIVGNTLSGIEINQEANPTVRRNRIRNGKSSGIIIHTSGRGTIEGNDICNNGYSGINVREGGDPIIRNNRLTGNREGIRIRESAGSYIDNWFAENVRGAWDIDAASAGRITRSGNTEQ